MIPINDSVLLMMVGMLNFLGAILLARARTKDGEEGLPSQPFPAPVQESGRDTVLG